MKSVIDPIRTCFACASIAALLFAGACSRSLGPSGLEESPYAAALEPDALVKNFELAWENRDIDAYRDLVLYDGVAPAVDGETYEPFVFYRIDYARDPSSVQGYVDEVANVERMFSGRPSRDGKVPGIKRISVELSKNQDWTDIGGERCQGDVFPAGTQRCVFECDAFFELESSYAAPGRSDPVTGFTVRTLQEFVVIPVQARQAWLQRPEYRLWKWLELPKLAARGGSVD